MVVIVEEVPTIDRREMIDREKADFNLAIFNNIYYKQLKPNPLIFPELYVAREKSHFCDTIDMSLKACFPLL